MPFPFILGVAGLAALGATGIGKGVKAGVDNHHAKEKNQSAERIVENARNKAQTFRENSNAAIQSLGERKVQVLDNSVQDFIALFDQLHHFELKDSIGLDEIQNFKLDRQSFDELRSMSSMATSMLGGAAAGVTAGALTAFGAYSGAVALATASTGTAIASLSGAAATNATLAFFGGGSLAAGGLGMAGGAVVLGGAVAAPALAVLGFVLGAKASANLDNARANLAQAQEFEEEMKTLCTLCQGIRLRAAMLERLLIKLNALLVPLNYAMEQTVLQSGTDYSTYTPEQKQTVAAALSLVGAIKAVLDTALLTEEGTLTEESAKVAETVMPALQAAS